jgi:lysophospholipase L1-like esterase
MRIGFFGDSLTSGVPGSSYVAFLRERLPNDTLLNFGRGNDTVVSLYRRILAMQFDKPLDIACVWIGVSDVPQRDGWLSRAFHALLGQRRARDLDEFRSFFRATLGLLCDKGERVVVAPPALRGENLENHWNRCLADLARVMQGVAGECDRAVFLNLRAAFARELAARSASDHVPASPVRVVLDALTLRTAGQIDGAATQRRLHLTLDGVHLNSAGARLVAQEFVAVIDGLACPVQHVR